MSPWMTATALTVDAIGQAAPNPDVSVNSLWDFITKGGPMMLPIGIASLVALTVFIERLISLRRVRVIPADFIAGLKSVLTLRASTQPALEYCRRNASPLASIIEVGIRHLREPLDVLERRVTDAGQREILVLRKFMRVLAVIAAIAPLMGLLGTIFGMIDAFATVATSGEALGKTELLAKGIYEAMITTSAGLLLAIPVLIAYHYLNARIDGLVLEMDRITLDFLETYTTGTSDHDAAERGTGAAGNGNSGNGSAALRENGSAVAGREVAAAN